MIDTAITITVPPEKRKEVLLTFKAILGLIRSEKGCISCNCCVDVEAENTILFKEEWESSDDLGTHLRSAHFNVLIGAMKLLDKKPEIRFNTIPGLAEFSVLQLQFNPENLHFVADPLLFTISPGKTILSYSWLQLFFCPASQIGCC